MSDSRDYLGEYARTVQERIRQVDTVLRTNDRLVEQSKAVIDRSWDLLRTAPQMDTPHQGAGASVPNATPLASGPNPTETATSTATTPQTTASAKP